jgi:hypothetical protein
MTQRADGIRKNRIDGFLADVTVLAWRELIPRAN